MNILVDSDFFVALYKPDDANHHIATKIFRKLGSDNLSALNIVFQEATTVISKRMNMSYAIKFHDSISRLISNEIKLDNILEENSWKIFLSQTKKGTSFVDCANLAAMEYYKLDGILSFDEFYKNKRVKN